MQAGTRLGQYEILAPLGAGGMGEVYRARDTRLGREVALKLLPEELALDPDRLARFEREARALAALNHPNIVTVYSVDEVAAVRFITMEVVEGRTLSELIPARGLAIDALLRLAIPLADALAAAHARGVIHRDLKPGNVMVSAEARLKVLDFGLAKMTAAGAAGADPELTATGLTHAGQVLGTVPYMSPEQVEGRSVDHRSDIFSLGTMLYQMATGKRPFTGNTPASVMSAILRDTPASISASNPGLPIELSRIVTRCLQKNPEQRYASADDLRAELKALETSLAPARPARLSRKVWTAIAAVVVVAAAVAGWLWERASRVRWALETATPEIALLVRDGEFEKAAALIRKARTVLPKDPALEKLWMEATGEATVDTVPRGAEVSIRPYEGDPNACESLGNTPLAKVRVPSGVHVWRIAKPGFAEWQLLMWAGLEGTFKLYPEGTLPPGMVPVFGEETGLPFPHQTAPAVKLDDYFIDRHEVTNEEYQKFVDAGGYQKREFWKQPFLKDGRAVPWEEAVARFKDTTGRPGPATWEVGNFPKGKERHPVAGVSWYEAAAYAEFAGKSLPTAYHWTQASELGFAATIAPGSNFGNEGTQPVGGPGTGSGFGTTDMAGNVKEWCWNESVAGKRFILGGGFGEQSYMFILTDAQSPWDREPNHGFRCVMLPSPAVAEAFAKLEPLLRDFTREKPVSDEVYRAFKGLYAYDKVALNAKIEERETTEEWTREKVSFDAAYGGERLAVHVFLPKSSSPPFQTVVYFPPANAQFETKFDPSFIAAYHADFVVRSGRALAFPIYKSSFERHDEWKVGLALKKPALLRDHMIMWSKDLSRSLDYLETRPDLESSKFAYLGYSWGARVAPVNLAVDGRFKAAVMIAAGFWYHPDPPEADPLNFVTRVRTPLLMLNGRYDTIYPLEASQLPFFRLLGTPEADKKHIVYESGHGLPWKEVYRETLDWFDKYLGPVKR